MGRVFKSGAFLQQCYEAHGQDLSCTRVDPPATIFFSCRSCDISSRISLRTVAADDPQVRAFLADCVGNHPKAIRLETMKVERDTVTLFCTQCRTTQPLGELTFESVMAD